MLITRLTATLRNRVLVSVITMLPAAVMVSLVAADDLPFPARTPGVEIGYDKLPPGYEPSGAFWHSRLQKLLLVSDDGWLTIQNRDGSDQVTYFDLLEGHMPDFEAITVADVESDFVYIGAERRPLHAIYEISLSEERITRTFDLSEYMGPPDNSNIEALAFLPDTGHPEGGVFYAGNEEDGKIYILELPIKTSRDSEVVTFHGTLDLTETQEDIGDLAFDASTGILYSLWDTQNRLRASLPDGTLLYSWSIPSGYQDEALTFIGCDLLIGDDGGSVQIYTAWLPGCIGDMNCDGGVDFDDIDPFVTALVNRADYEALFPDCVYERGDANYSGEIDFEDVDKFVELILN